MPKRTLAITPPSALRITTVAERGAAAGAQSGQLEKRRAAPGRCARWGFSPGCCTLMNIVRPSGVQVAPVISQPTGPVRKRRISPAGGSQASIWLLPSWPARPCPSAVATTCRSGSTARPRRRRRGRRGRRRVALDVALGLGAFVAPGRRPAAGGSSGSGAVEVAVVLPADDLAHVLLARGLAASTPGWPGRRAAVVGERAVDPAAAGRWPATRAGPSWWRPAGRWPGAP
jgi:hypothetical protein